MLSLEEGVLYTTLHRLELHGVLTSQWRVGEDHRRAKYYRLQEERASRPEVAREVLALMLIAALAARPVRAGEACNGVTTPVTFSGRIGSVRVLVNATPEIFVIDPASDTIINSDRLHLSVLHTLTASTVTTSGSAPVVWNLVRLRQFAIGGQEIQKRTALAKGLKELETALGHEVDGILGNDVFTQWDFVTLDYKNKALVLGCSGDDSDYERHER